MARKQRKNSRRANGEGSIVQRKDGRWCGAVLLGYKPDGTVSRKFVYGKTQTEVLEKMSELKHKLITGPVISNKALLGETMKEWLKVYKKSQVTDRTFEQNIRTFKNHIEPAFGNIPFANITTNMVQTLLTKKLQSHNGCPNTPKRIKFLLNQFYEYLIDNKLAYDNPTLRCKVTGRFKKTFIDSKGNMQYHENYKAIPEKERVRFIRSLDNGPDIIKPLSLVMMLASLRIGEALGLKWENIDFEKELLYVEQGLTENIEFDDDLNIVRRESIISTTKTSCSRRVIKMPKLVVEALQKWRKIQWCKEQTTGVSLTKPNNLVFCRDDGGVRGYDAIRRTFDRFTKKNGFRQEFGIHCHMLRQTFSNMQIEHNRNIKNVQHLLGHKDAKTTQLHYNSIVDQEIDYEGAKLLDNLFNEETLNRYEDSQEYKPKNIPAFNINLDNNGNLIEAKTEKTPEELEIELLQEMIHQREERLKKKRNKDFEM